MEIPMNELNELDLHDSPLYSIYLNGYDETLEIEFALWDIALHTSIKHKLVFTEPENIMFPEQFSMGGLEITRHEIIKIDDKYKAEFMVLIGFGEATFRLEFYFNRAELLRMG
jgi:hypothetical protein